MSLVDDLQLLKDGLAGADHRLLELFASSEVGACLIGPDGRFERLNPAWESCLGYQTNSMLGKAFLDFVHPDDRGPTQAATARLKREATVRFQNRVRQRDGTYRTLQWAAALADGTEAICAVVCATASGVEERRGGGAPTPFARLLRSVARAGDEPAQITGALQFALDRVCAQTGWPVGHALLPDEKSPECLISAKIWHLAEKERFFVFREESEQATAAAGRGLPGRVFASQLPACVHDLAAGAADVPHAQAALAAGLRSVFAFPVSIGGETLAVLEFFSTEVAESDAQLLEVMGLIGAPMVERNQHGRLQAALTQGAEELYRRVIETSSDAIFLTDLDARVLVCNQEAARLYGADSPDELIGGSGFDSVAPEDMGRAIENAARALAQGHLRSEEYTLLRRDGTRFPAQLSVSVISDAEGAPRAFVGVVRDLTERKRAEEALRSSEEMLVMGISQMPCIVWTTDTELRMTSLSGDALAPFNVNLAEQVGRTIYEIFGNDPVGVPPIAAHERALRGEEASYEQKVEDRQFEVRVRPFRDEKRGDIVGCVGIALDSTERKQAEKALAESEERYRVLYQDNPTMYFTVDANGTVLSVNQFGAGQLGYTADELVGQPVLSVFHEEDKTEVAAQLAHCIQQQGKVHDWEFRKVRKDGSVIWVKEAARATRDRNDETIVLIVCEDITERRQVEEELQRAREELEGKVEAQMQRGQAYGLTFRELTVLHLVSSGESDRQIAFALGISPLTASKHVANVLSKMGATSRSEASARAVREGLLS